MDPKWNILYELPSNLYTPGSPVLIEGGRLLINRSTGNLVIQAKYKNLESRKVRAMAVDVICLDPFGEQVSVIRDLRYLDLEAAPGETFGSKVPIPVQDTAARSFEITVRTVALSDGTRWDDQGGSWQALPAGTSLQNAYGADLAARYKIEVCNDFSKDSDVKFVPAEKADLWLCTCGQWNKRNQCSLCMREKAAVMSAANPQLLQEHLDAYLAEQEQLRIEQERRQQEAEAARRAAMERMRLEQEQQRIIKEAELERRRQDEEQRAAQRAEEQRVAAEKKRRKLRSLLIGALALLAVTVITAVICIFVIIPSKNYKAAAALRDEGRYEAAIDAFTDLGDYKDSKDQITFCKNELAYNAAIDLTAVQRYEDAIRAFEALNGYRDSTIQIKNCTEAINNRDYNAALLLMDAGQYKQAAELFTALGDYKDSADRAEICGNESAYAVAVEMMAAGKYEEAKEIFSALGDFKNSKDRITEADYLAACALRDAGEYEAAIAAFDTLGDYKNCKEQISACRKAWDELTEEQTRWMTVGNVVSFGHYEQDNNTANGPEEIDWQILAVDSDTNRALLISRYALDCKPYNEKYEETTWENCTLRNWLNEEFLHDAFSEAEQAKIPMVTVESHRNPNYSTNPGNDTQDKVFLLSITEAIKYFTSDDAMKAALTEYALAQGAWNIEVYMQEQGIDEAGLKQQGYSINDFKTATGEVSGQWWLRSPGLDSDGAAFVYIGGGVDFSGTYVHGSNGAVRPALWVDLGLDIEKTMNRRYDSALALREAGEYEAAIEDFTALGEYKDSAAQISGCKEDIKERNYNAAVAMREEGQYEAAIEAFTALDGYKDSEAQIEGCRTDIKERNYNDAVAMREAGQYEAAIEAFTALGNYKDSAAQITGCQEDIKEREYNAAGALLEAGKYDEAYDVYLSLRGYKDVDRLMAENAELLKVERARWFTVGSIVRFGHYEQDNNIANGPEEIEWLVLDVQGDRALIISRYALDCKQYNEKNTNTTWGKCTLRKWLNDEFLNSAFSDEEQQLIPKVTVKAHKNPEYNTNPGNDTQDKVFLLSITEAEQYFANDEARKAVATAYAKAQGAYTSSFKTATGEATCWWWLRSPGFSSIHAARVGSGGGVLYYGVLVINCDSAVRPALWVNLAS